MNGKLNAIFKVSLLALVVWILSLFPITTTPVSAKEDFSVIMITGDPNMDGANFILSAWEGLISFGRDNQLEEGEEGYHLLTVYQREDYQEHFQTAVEGDYDLIIALGSNAETYVKDFAEANKDQTFLLIDGDLQLPNVISVVFKDYEAAFLAGLAAALETETASIGFIGGADNETIHRFEKGFLAGVKEINPNIRVETVYLAWFDDISGAKEAASEMFKDGVDIIYHAAGQAGMGVFEAAQTAVTEGQNQLWVIGADADQTEAGEFIHEDQDYSITLSSTLKKLANVIQELTQVAYDGQLQAGVYEYGMLEGAIDISAGNLTDKSFDIVADYRHRMQAGDLDISSLILED